MSSAVVTFKAVPQGDDQQQRQDLTMQTHREKLGHRRIDEQGEVSYKKVPTNALMQAIQLGIANSIGSLASLPTRDLLLQDFEKVDNVTFPAAGSATTPSHSFGDFRFRTYAPIAFRYFRDLFHIKPADFLRSICTEPLQELTNAGASGSIFYVSQDDQFIIKTVQHKEAEFLQKLLPGYYMNLNQNPRTLLPKFFGLFCYQSLGKNIRLLVMNNLLPQTVPIHEKYDLKGSTYKRMSSKAEKAKAHPTLKDLDFLEMHRDGGLLLEPIALEALIKTISRDCLVLESFKIMDYSLLVGVHNLALSSEQCAGDVSSSAEKAHSPSQHSQKWSVWDTSDPNTPYGGVPARNANGDHLILYLGIIDILQNYRLLKKFEHTWKALLHDGDTISVHNPSFYAQRFLTFMTEHVFRKGAALRQSPSRRRATSARRSLGDDEEEPEAPPLNSAKVVAQSARDVVQRSGSIAHASTPVSARDVVPILPGGSVQPLGATRGLSLRKSYRDGAVNLPTASNSGDKQRDKRVERLFATSANKSAVVDDPICEEAVVSKSSF